MRLFFQSPCPQRRPMSGPGGISLQHRNSTGIDHQGNAQRHVTGCYDRVDPQYNYHFPLGQPYNASCQINYPPPLPYARMHSPFPPPPIQRTSTPPPPNVIYVHPQSPNKVSNKGHSPSRELIYEIRENDVLCGRGAPSQYQAGNKFFREIVERFQSSYIAARRIDKPEIATHIVDLVRERGGRFLKRVKIQGVGPSGHFCWQDIGEQRAYEKACQALREGQPEIRRKLAAKEIAAAALCTINNTYYPHDHHPNRSPINYISPLYKADDFRDESLSDQRRSDSPCDRE